MDRCQSCFREFEGKVCPHCGYPEKGHNASHQLPVGTVLRGRYQIGKSLGQGGFGITYLAWDKLMLQTVAVKEFYPNGTVFRKSATSLAVECGTEEIVPHYEYTRQRFLREAGALVKFRGIPEIVDILDFAEENNTSYIVMEFVRGVDLAKYIRMKGGRLSPEETFRILKPVMEALAKVHKGGIVHRDISPDNIILDPMGGAKLLDFGAVRAVEDPDVEKGLNKSTEAILKQGFAPIEQYNTRGSLGPWTDEYAMCATVWYCLTGRVPEEASIRVSEGIDPDWSSIEGLPIHQQKALAKGFSCRAKDRYKGIDELLADLFPDEQVTAVTASQVMPEPKKEQPPEPPKKPSPKIRQQNKQPSEAAEEFRAGDTDPRLRRRLRYSMIAAAVAAVVLLVMLLWPTKQFQISSLRPHRELNGIATTSPLELSMETEETTPPTTVPPTTVPPSPEEEAYLQAESLLAEGKLGEAAIAFGKLSGFSDARERSFAIWEQITARDTVSAGGAHTVGLRADGTVVAVGDNGRGQCNVSGWTDVVSIAASDYHTVGLRADGTVVAVGDNGCGQCNVGSWTNIVSISAGSFYTAGLKSDGTVVAVGDNGNDQCCVSAWTNIVAISAGHNHTAGLKADGTVVAIGQKTYGQRNVGDWTDMVAIAAGYLHTIGLRADGTVVAVGDNSYGQCDVEGWTDVVAIAVGDWHTVGLRADGTVVAVGADRCDVSGWTNVVAIAAGGNRTVSLCANGTVVCTRAITDTFEDRFRELMNSTDDWTDIRLPHKRVPFR